MARRLTDINTLWHPRTRRRCRLRSITLEKVRTDLLNHMFGKKANDRTAVLFLAFSFWRSWQTVSPAQRRSDPLTQAEIGSTTGTPRSSLSCA